MKINEVEAQVGVTKKNIRFYEEKGLIAPRRNSENGYREYGPGEVEQLKQIKLLRKLGVPLEEIRRMQSGGHTVGDGMRRHLVTLERERENLERSMELCRTLKDWEQRLDTLEADGLLERMEEMEREGTTFKDKQREDARPVRYAAAVAASLIMVAFMAGAMALMAWGFTVEPEEAPPLALMAVLIALPGVVILGVLYALYQRIREIQKGEEDDANNYEREGAGRRDRCGGRGGRAGFAPESWAGCGVGGAASRLCRAGSGRCGGSAGRGRRCHCGPVPPVEGDPGR